MLENNLRAAIWDMDGVIADTGIYHYRAWKEAFRKRGSAFTRADFRSIFGQRNDTIIRKIVGTVSPEELNAISEDKEADYRRRVAQNIKALPGVIPLLRSLADGGVKTAVASSAPIQDIQMIIRSLAIEDCFQAIAWGGEVAEGKPSPLLFLLAAKRLGVPPRNCVVFEDAIAGVAAARRAGMRCVAITNTSPKASLKEADLIVDTLEAVSVSDLEALLDHGLKNRY